MKKLFRATLLTNESTQIIHVTQATQYQNKPMASTSSGTFQNNCINSNNFEIIKELVTAQLKKEGIKLWLAPYTREEDSQVGEFPIELIERYSTLFNISSDQVATAIETLRENAVKKFAANKKFKACGVATLKLKFVDKKSGYQSEKIETGLQVNGSRLKEKMKTMFNFKEEEIKLICHGRIIADDKTLEEQGVQNNNFVMVVTSHKDEIAKVESTMSQVTRTKHAANILATKKGGDEDYYLEISDQNGKPLDLPDGERKSLVLAMSLHERGKRILKEGKFTEALVLLLGADEEFRQCGSEVLNAVDNYAILCLDIVWCYLQLKSIKELPNAEEMLKKCETCLQKSYGENLERLVSLTGSSAKEKVLYVRLYLLQAICAFHKGDMKIASLLLEKAEREISNLKVDDASLSQMLSMGFSTSESRLALRACQGDITSAVGYISRKREEEKRQVEERKERINKQKVAKKLGKTVNGNWIDVDTYNSLREMGFLDVAAKESLRQANNNMDAALQILHDRSGLLEFSNQDHESYNFEEIPDDVIAQVTAMGFDVATAQSVLQYYRGNINRTIEKLFECGGTLPPECEEMTQRKKKDNTPMDGGETSQQVQEQQQQQRQRNSDEEREIEEALDEMRGAFDGRNNEESHLDLTLEEEADFMNEYRTMIVTRTQMEKH